MKVWLFRLAGVVCVLIGILLVYSGTTKTITLLKNGDREILHTHSLRVKDLLSAQAVQLAIDDHLRPGNDHFLNDGETIQLDQSAWYLISTDGKVSRLHSSERIPGNVLAQAGLQLFPGDRILVDGKPAPAGDTIHYAPTHSLQLLRGVSFNMDSSTGEKPVTSSRSTIGQALADNGIYLLASDYISPTLERSPVAVSKVEWRPAQTLEVEVSGERQQIRTPARTVGEALAQAGLPLQGLDYSVPAPNEPVSQVQVIHVVRVKEELAFEQTPLPFESELQPAPEVELDQTAVLQPGQPGVTTRRVRIRYEDGKEVTRRIEAEWVSSKPVKQVVGYGTKVVVRKLNTPGGTIEYWRAVPMYATSYAPCRIFKDHCDSYTASGAELKRGIVAMRGYWYTYYGGTQVYVPGYGNGTVADVGGGIPGRFWLDLGYSDSDYVSWHQTVMVYFLTPVPSDIMWILK